MVASNQGQKRLRSFGILTTADAKKATHLAAPHIVRTQKFVTALAYAPMVLSTNFIDSCLEADELLDPEDFLLDDKENEKKIGFKLKVSRERARKNQNQLLKGISIYCAESIHGGFDTFKTIVDANGGQCMMWRNRKHAIVPSTRAGIEDDSDEDNVVYLLSDNKRENQSLWERFKEMAQNSRKTPRLISPDWLLESAMSQELRDPEPYDNESSSGQRA